jgi:alpha-methylacyl-CoA racemase
MGTLSDLTFVEMAAEGPIPLAAMMLADMGAQVVRVEQRTDAGLRRAAASEEFRGRRSIAVDLKKPRGREILLALLARSDALLEGFRPGVAERLGFGPDDGWALNPRLVYARMTGWGQDGPLSRSAGHDLNYIALSGALYPIGPADRAPTPPLYFLGDYGGGAMMLAFGVLAGIHEAARSGQGQVIDCSIVDGVSQFMTRVRSQMAAGTWDDRRGHNHIDGGAPFYQVYETSDGGYISIAPLEPKFYAELLRLLELDPEDLPAQYDRSSWPGMRVRFAHIFLSRTRAEWCQLLENSDACFAPVLTPAEAVDHPHNVARRSFSTLHGSTYPSPAPRFSRTHSRIGSEPAAAGSDTREVLAELGYAPSDVDDLVKAGVIDDH